jgi:hypothetical protein
VASSRLVPEAEVTMVIQTLGEPYANPTNVLNSLLRAERELREVIHAEKHGGVSVLTEAHALLRETIDSLSKAVQPERKS